MFRTIAYATFLTLTVTAVQADPREDSIRKAAESACAPIRVDLPPDSFYGVTYRTCVDRVTRATRHRIEAAVEARARMATAMAN